jgi:hypothetical protein
MRGGALGHSRIDRDFGRSNEFNKLGKSEFVSGEAKWTRKKREKPIRGKIARFCQGAHSRWCQKVQDSEMKVCKEERQRRNDSRWNGSTRKARRSKDISRRGAFELMSTNAIQMGHANENGLCRPVPSDSLTLTSDRLDFEPISK